MVSRPTLKRFYSGRCTQCGKPLDRSALISRRFPTVRYAHGEALWCRLCARRVQERAWANEEELMAQRATQAAALRTAYINWLLETMDEEFFPDAEV